MDVHHRSDNSENEQSGVSGPVRSRDSTTQQVSSIVDPELSLRPTGTGRSASNFVFALGKLLTKGK
jgi:hypothetical protein